MATRVKMFWRKIIRLGNGDLVKMEEDINNWALEMEINITQIQISSTTIPKDDGEVGGIYCIAAVTYV